MKHLGVLGAGAWGTALALVAARQGPVTLWSHEPETAATIAQTGVNARFLPDISLPGITATADLAALAGCDALIVAVPVSHLAAVLARAEVGARPLLLCAKGIAPGGLLPHELAAATCPAAPLAALSGPSFAAEVARGLPTALTLAAADPARRAAWIARLAAPAFRLYPSDDLVGVEVGGAVKNVLAIAAGVVIGAGLGENARAATVARGLAEMVRYAVARDGRAETLAGLSGLGDLVLTCGSPQSRNMALGIALGRGTPLEGALAALPGVAEGAATAPILAADARARGVAMPITQAVDDLLGGRLSVGKVIARLLERPVGSE